MPIYEYKCVRCGALIDSLIRADKVDCECGHFAQRRFSFTHKPDMPAHFNHSTGTYVRNEREFKDDLKRISAETSARTGIETNYVPTDISNPNNVGVTTEGLDSTYDAASEEKRKAMKAHLKDL